MTQMEANKLYEGPNIDMPKKYSGIIRLMLLATFYAPAIPFALIFTLLGLTLWYWADKVIITLRGKCVEMEQYTLLRRIALPKSVNNVLADSMVEYLEWTAGTFAVKKLFIKTNPKIFQQIGNVIYTYTLKNSFGEPAFSGPCKALAWVTLGISLFHIYFPMQSLNKKVFSVKAGSEETETFDFARINFTTVSFSF